jgi:hypothetical protein
MGASVSVDVTIKQIGKQTSKAALDFKSAGRTEPMLLSQLEAITIAKPYVTSVTHIVNQMFANRDGAVALSMTGG